MRQVEDRRRELRARAEPPPGRFRARGSSRKGPRDAGPRERNRNGSLVGQGFIRLMQMLVVPLVFCSIVCGAAAIDTKTLGSVGLKTLLLYLLTTAAATEPGQHNAHEQGEEDEWQHVAIGQGRHGVLRDDVEQGIHGVRAFLPMVKYMGAVLAALALQLGVTYMALLWAGYPWCSSRPPRRGARHLRRRAPRPATTYPPPRRD